MNYFLISKSDKIFKSDKKITPKGGYKFNQKIAISLYNNDMIRYILTKKINKSLKDIINLYLLNEEDADGCEELMPKIEFLRSLLIEKYSKHLNQYEVDAYLTKLEKLESKMFSSHSKKSRRRWQKLTL